MKFKVREGYVAKLIKVLDLGDGKTETQEATIYGGQIVDLTAEEADLHAHKLEPLDKQATAFLDAKVLPTTQATSAGITPEMAAFAEAFATKMIAAVQAATAPAPAVAAPTA